MKTAEEAARTIVYNYEWGIKNSLTENELIESFEGVILKFEAEIRKDQENITINACTDENIEYNHQGMGCGLEDRNITNRYDAMEYGFNKGVERVFEAIKNINTIE